MSDATPVLSYDGFDHALESERARWLRARFLWFCGVTFVLTFAMEAGPRWLARLADEPSLASGPIDLASSIASAAIAGTAFVVVLLRKVGGAGVLRLALWVTVLSGAVGMVSARLGATFEQLGAANPPSRQEVAEEAAVVGMAAILPMHLVVCLFIPWTVRECLRAGAGLVAVYGALVTADLAMGNLGGHWVVLAPLSALALGPGLLVCWWRFSRFRRNFRLAFESRRYRELREELAGARRVHESSLPAPLRDGPVRLEYVYEPARQIGGDLIFLGPRDAEGRVCLVVLDVTGHGIAAALTVNRVVGELERLLAEDPGAAPAEVLRRLDHYVHLTLSRHAIFATALCARIDPGRGEVEWARGGHPPGLLVRGRGAEVVELAGDGMMLGVLGPDEYEVTSSADPLGPGDALVLYTDGAHEAMSPAGTMLGLDGLKALVQREAAAGQPVERWPQRILRGVIEHRQGPPGDDTLVAVVFIAGEGREKAEGRRQKAEG